MVSDKYKNIDRIIFGLNNNEVYIDYWNFLSKFYKIKFNVIPTLFFVGTDEEFVNLKESGRLSEEYGEIYHLERSQNIPYSNRHEQHMDWTPTWGLFYGASKFTDEVCMLSGIDQIALSSHFFNLVKGKNPRENYIIGFGDAYDVLGNKKTVSDKENTYVVYPSSHHVGTGKMYKEIYDIEDNWIAEVEKVYSYLNKLEIHQEQDAYHAGNGWGLDEIYSSYMIGKNKGVNVIINQGFFSDWRENSRHTEFHGSFILNNELENKIKNNEIYEYSLGKPFNVNDIDSLNKLFEIVSVYNN